MLDNNSYQMCLVISIFFLLSILLCCFCKNNIDHFINSKDIDCDNSNKINNLLKDANCNLNNNNSCSLQCAETYTPIYNKCGVFGKGSKNLNIQKFMRCQNPDYSNDLNSNTGPSKSDCTNIANNFIKPKCGDLLNSKVPKEKICSDNCKNIINNDWINVNCSKHFSNNNNLNENITTLNNCGIPQSSSNSNGDNDSNNGFNGDGNNGFNGDGNNGFNGDGNNGFNGDGGGDGDGNNGFNGYGGGDGDGGGNNGFNGYNESGVNYEDENIYKPLNQQLCSNKQDLYKNINNNCCDTTLVDGNCNQVPDAKNVCLNTSKNKQCINSVKNLLNCYPNDIENSFPDYPDIQNFFNTCENMINNTPPQPTIQSNRTSNNICNNFTNNPNGVISSSDFRAALSKFGKSCNNNNINCLPNNNGVFGEDEIRTILACKK